MGGWWLKGEREGEEGEGGVVGGAPRGKEGAEIP